MRQLTKEEKDALCIALNCRRNIIETGNYTLGAVDVEKLGKNAAQEGVAIKALSIDQMKLIILTADLVTKILSDKVMITG